MLLLASAAPSAHAQYIYLDSNGDGLHTAADVITAQGVTNVDVWLYTNQNRDGTTVTCAQDPTRAMSILGYELVVRATDGTVSWGPFVNRFLPAGLVLFNGGDPTAWDLTAVGLTPSPPGLYRIASFTVSVASGTPSLELAERTYLQTNWFQTMFGSMCLGASGSNTIALGTDFQDADGLAYSSGTTVNHPPLLTPPTDMTVFPGVLSDQTLTASDADGQSLAFAKTEGPAFLDVLTIDPGSGTANGRALVMPRIGDVGVSTAARVSVSDGIASDERSFHIEVAPGPGHPPWLSVPAEWTIPAGTIARVPVYAADSDGEPLSLLITAGPSYAWLDRASSGEAATTALLAAAPTTCDIGSAEIQIEAADQGSLALGTVRARVPPVFAPPEVISQSYDLGDLPSGLALGDWNRDGLLDVAVSTSGSISQVLVFAGTGDGALGSAVSYRVGRGSHRIAAADLDRDGALDLAVSNLQDGTVTILHGAGDGSFQKVADLADLPSALGLIAADFNGDGWPDLAIAGSFSGTVSVRLNDGAGGFPSGTVLRLPGASASCTTADFDRDGALDLVASGTVQNPAGLYYLPGYGDGTFGAPRTISLASLIHFTAAADLNSDGLADLLAVSFERSSSALLGDGRGGFPVVRDLGQFGPLAEVAVGEWNGDGFPDLLTTSEVSAALRLGYGDGTFRYTGGVPGGGEGLVALGDMNGDGRADAVNTNVLWRKLWITLNPGSGAARARAFVEGGPDVIPNAPSQGHVQICYEPVNGTYSNTEVDPSTVRLRSEGSGTVSEIPAVPERTAIEVDRDRNGVAERSARFSRSDLATLFSGIPERRTVTAELVGGLRGGRRFCAPVEFEVVATGVPPQRLAASLAPNPLNPSARLSVTTSRTGPLRVRVFDLRGRLVRTLLEQASAPAGSFDLEIDGRDGRGRDLASGMYFYRIEAGEETVEGRFTILR